MCFDRWTLRRRNGLKKADTAKKILRITINVIYLQH